LSGLLPQTRRWLLRLVQIGAAVGIFAILWHAADGREALRLLANADPWWFVGAIAALTVQTILSALRWRLTASRLGIMVDVRTAVREYYLSQVINQSLPGGMVGDAARAVRSRGQAGLAKAGQAVVLERLMGQIVMFLFLAGAFAATWIAPGGLVWPSGGRFPAGARPRRGLRAAAAPVVRDPDAGLLGRWASLLHEIIHAGLMQRGTLGRQVLISIGTASCNLAAFAFCARAVGVSLPLGTLLADRAARALHDAHPAVDERLGPARRRGCGALPHRRGHGGAGLRDERGLRARLHPRRAARLVPLLLGQKAETART
jgi:glycosyltransferase 2 family protein